MFIPKNNMLFISIEKKEKKKTTTSGIFLPEKDNKDYYDSVGTVMATCDNEEYPLESKVFFDITAKVHVVPGSEDIAISTRDILGVKVMPRTKHAVDVTLDKSLDTGLCNTCEKHYPMCSYDGVDMCEFKGNVAVVCTNYKEISNGGS